MRGQSVGLFGSLFVAIVAFGLLGTGRLPFDLLAFSNSAPSESASVGDQGLSLQASAGTQTDARPVSPQDTATTIDRETPIVPAFPTSGPLVQPTSSDVGAAPQSAAPSSAAPAVLAPASNPVAPTNVPEQPLDAASTATPPTAAPAPARIAAQKRIGIQAGHWLGSQLPDELASLRKNTGAEGKGWAERDINLGIARQTAALLEAAGYKVDLLPATVPVNYKADVFLSLHGDANSSTAPRGFKAARASLSPIPALDDTLLAAIYEKYGQITGLPRDDNHITNNMRYYYAFASSRLQHTVAPTTPAAILEMGFLTNPTDRALLLSQPDLIARAVAASLEHFLNGQP